MYDGGSTPANLGTPYGIPLARMDAHGGWIGTPTDLLRFAARADGFATVPDILQGATMGTPSAANPVDGNPGYGMGWWVNAVNNWWHDGLLAGTEAFLVRTNDGICWAALASGNGIDLEATVWGMIDRIDAWPEGESLQAKPARLWSGEALHSLAGAGQVGEFADAGGLEGAGEHQPGHERRHVHIQERLAQAPGSTDLAVTRATVRECRGQTAPRLPQGCPDREDQRQARTC